MTPEQESLFDLPPAELARRLVPRTPKPPKRYPVPPGASEEACRSCGAVVVWIVTERGADMPLSVASIENGEAISHFADCPHAAGWSRGKR